MMSPFKKAAFVFPGQGAQYPSMGRDFWQEYAIARETFEEADEILGKKLSTTVFEGPEQLLTETKNSQLGIYVCSIAILRVLQQLFPEVISSVNAGLSLGEYSALTASGRLRFAEGVSLVDHRARYMNDACEASQGTMAVVLGLEAALLEKIIAELHIPNDIWVANYNCPGQIVISGTLKGIQQATEALKANGAKRVLPLQVHGAFHSGLMKSAEERLTPIVETVPLQKIDSVIVMNVTGSAVNENSEIRRNLIKQVTHPVRWEQSMRYMIQEGVDFFLECGPGKILAGFNKRIGENVPFASIEKVADISMFEKLIRGVV
jgi:[acyl-carrier-protein] S-malonyltransferase